MWSIDFRESRSATWDAIPAIPMQRVLSGITGFIQTTWKAHWWGSKGYRSLFEKESRIMRGINTIINSVYFDLIYTAHISFFFIIKFLENIFFILCHIYFIAIIKLVWIKFIWFKHLLKNENKIYCRSIYRKWHNPNFSILFNYKFLLPYKKAIIFSAI